MRPTGQLVSQQHT